MTKRKSKRRKRRSRQLSRPQRAAQGTPTAVDELSERDIPEALRALVSGMSGMIQDLRQSQRKARERQRAVLESRNPTLAECIAPYTKNALSGMLDALEIRGAKGLLKAAMAERIMQELRDLERLAVIVGRLTNREREALCFVLSPGGMVPSADFVHHYDHDLDESPYWGYPSHQPESTMGRLRVRGLLAEGIIEGQVLTVIPRELRGLLKKLLVQRIPEA